MDGVSAPRYNAGRHCKKCSLNEFCMPEETGARDRSARYVAGLYRTLAEKSEDEEDER